MRILCHLQSEDYGKLRGSLLLIRFFYLMFIIPCILVGINVMQEIVPDVDYAVFAASHEEALQSMPETTSAGQERNEIAVISCEENSRLLSTDDIIPSYRSLGLQQNAPLWMWTICGL